MPSLRDFWGRGHRQIPLLTSCGVETSLHRTRAEQHVHEMVSRFGIDQTICKFGGSFANQRLNQIFFLFLKTEYYIHKILTSKYWHVILKLAIFNGPKPLSTTVKIVCLLVLIKNLMNWNWDNFCSGDFNSCLSALWIHLGLVNSILQKQIKSTGSGLYELPYESHKGWLCLCLWCYNSQKCC